MTGGNIRTRIHEMLAMLEAGEFLKTFDQFYRDDARFFENEYLFAESREEARQRQASFLNTCSSFVGKIELVHADIGRRIAVFHNKSRYEHPDYGAGQVNGVHVAYWHDDLIVREEYFSGKRVEEVLSFWRLVGRSSTQ